MCFLHTGKTNLFFVLNFLIDDIFISRKIYEKYGGDKNLILVEGDHNTPRPKYLYDSIAIFLQSTLQVKTHFDNLTYLLHIV